MIRAQKNRYWRLKPLRTLPIYLLNLRMINRLRILLGHWHGTVLRRFCGQKRLLKLRFAVNQAAAQSHGIECDRPVVTIEIEPTLLTNEDKRRLGQRMLGIDVCEGVVRADGSKGPAFTWDRHTYQDPYSNPTPVRLEAELPTLEGLLQALNKDDRRLAEQAPLRCQAI